MTKIIKRWCYFFCCQKIFANFYYPGSIIMKDPAVGDWVRCSDRRGRVEYGILLAIRSCPAIYSVKILNAYKMFTLNEITTVMKKSIIDDMVMI